MNYKKLGEILLTYNSGIEHRTSYDYLVAEILEYCIYTVGIDQEITEYDLYNINKEKFDDMVSEVKDSIHDKVLERIKEQVQELMGNGCSEKKIIAKLFD